MKKIVICTGMLAALALTGCASGHYKARQEQREKLATSTGMYCEWINGEKYTDVDVELSLQMAKRCDSSKSFSITTYKNTSDQNGVIYCCSVPGHEAHEAAIKESASAPASSAKPASTPNKKEPEEQEIKE